MSAHPAACLDCGLDYEAFPLDTMLSDDDWLLVHPEDDGLLCAGCIARRVAKLPHVIVLFARIVFDHAHEKWSLSVRQAKQREAIHQAIVRLSPWTNHMARCARVTDTEACNCGLQAELEQHQWSI